MLPVLPHSEKLLHLYLDINVEGDHDLAAVLPAFTSLETLSYISPYDTRFLDPAVFDALREMPRLRKLEFGLHTLVSPDELLRLVQGPSRHSSFRYLQLDHFEEDWHGGASILEFGPYWNKDEGRYEAHGWHLPMVYSFSDDQAAFVERYDELLAAAKSHGVVVEGTVFPGLETVKGWEKEVELGKWWENAPPPFSPAELAFYTHDRHTGQPWNGVRRVVPEEEFQ